MRFPLEIAEVTVRSGINRALCDRWGANWPTDPAFRQLAAAKTLGKLDDMSERSVLAHLAAERVRLYGRIISSKPDQARFAAGWLNRVAEFVESLA